MLLCLTDLQQVAPCSHCTPSDQSQNESGDILLTDTGTGAGAGTGTDTGTGTGVISCEQSLSLSLTTSKMIKGSFSAEITSNCLKAGNSKRLESEDLEQEVVLPAFVRQFGCRDSAAAAEPEPEPWLQRGQVQHLTAAVLRRKHRKQHPPCSRNSQQTRSPAGASGRT